MSAAPLSVDALDFDVAIVGYGPVGQSLAALLGQAGYRVGVFERWPGLYPLPRACVVDHEIMRILQTIGIADAFAKLVVPTNGEYLWLNAEGKTLYHFKNDKDGVSGWPARNLMYQPDLERLLDQRVRALPSVELNQGWQAVHYTDHADHAELQVQAALRDDAEPGSPPPVTRRVTARYVVGADGANSFVRQAAGMPWVDLGFRADWLVVDFRPHDPTRVLDMPEAGQICDPARPITLMRHMGHRHVRWEMMLLPGETAEDITQPDKVWSMIDRWVKPGDGVVERAAVYTFRSGVAHTWVRGHALLVGDAAHLMPPFLGQGLCSGVRDALAAFWRLHAVLGGASTPALLQSYEQERKAHVTTVIERAVALGKVVCITDPAEAARRDEAILKGSAAPIPAFPGLVGGLLHRSADGSLPQPVGQLAPQARVQIGRQVGRMDELLGSGWYVITLEGAVEAMLADGQAAFLAAIGARVVAIGGDATDAAGILDIDGAYRTFMTRHGVRALIVRPDFYIFAAATSLQEVSPLLSELQESL